MSPGVGIPSSNLKPELELAEEPASLAALEESLGQFFPLSMYSFKFSHNYFFIWQYSNFLQM